LSKYELKQENRHSLGELEIEKATFFCAKCESWFEYAYELILHDPTKCKRIKEDKNMTNLSEALTQATARVSTNTELLQQVTAIVAMNVPDDTKVILLNGIGKAIEQEPAKTAPAGVVTKAVSPAQDPNIRAYLKADTGNLVIKGAIGYGRSFGTLTLNTKSPQISKLVMTSNSLPVQVDFSEAKKSLVVSYPIERLSITETEAIQKFLANPPQPKAKQPDTKNAKVTPEVPSPQPKPQEQTIDQSIQVQIFNDASTLLQNGLAQNMEEALMKAKKARGIV